ncbi:adenosylcobinamide-GDP ribazoletransferase [Corynebacterium sp. 335C]
MSGKAGFSPEGSGEHGPALVEGVTTALSWLTVVPLRGASVFDRTTGRRAIAALPVAGLVPGLAAAAVVGLCAWAAGPAGVPGAAAPLVGAVAVLAQVALTRGMHLDGVADVADALGSYGDREKARAVLADAATGPMGVGAVVLALLTQAAGLAAVAGAGLPAWAAAGAAALPAVLGRAAATAACRRGWPPLREGGFGGLVAATQPTWVPAVWFALLALAGFAVAGAAGIVAAAAAAGAGVVLARHAVRRLGGVNGDVLGAVIEAAATAAAVVLGLGPGL